MLCEHVANGDAGIRSPGRSQVGENVDDRRVQWNRPGTSRRERRDAGERLRQRGDAEAAGTDPVEGLDLSPATVHEADGRCPHPLTAGGQRNLSQIQEAMAPPAGAPPRAPRQALTTSRTQRLVPWASAGRRTRRRRREAESAHGWIDTEKTQTAGRDRAR